MLILFVFNYLNSVNLIESKSDYDKKVEIPLNKFEPMNLKNESVSSVNNFFKLGSVYRPSRGHGSGVLFY